jgi:Asp-tRNA(Asn)/Glu-tRNA(Gln) amidotransferase A subunit family amidase
MADDRSLTAERLRGTTQSHRDWVLDDGARGRLRAQWRELFGTFDAVICPIMPTPAYPHDHSPQQEARRIRIDGKDHVYPDQLAWRHRHPARPAGHGDSARPVAAGPAGRRADRRPLAGGSHAIEAGGTDRARIRRVRAAADV